ncbi:hypothetical protein [Salinicola peritrichatus]|uniref:hypothetical protein n=1 Tax=Salinicola peritrichatus TaxID=1267424 RepID=UPI000DA1473E|nr:hypothetical protein [Salinicola peritrichatus]
MAGLDTRGLASGLAQGLGLGMKLQNQERQAQYQNARMQQYERGLDMREQQYNDQREQQQKARQLEQDKLLAQSGYARLAAGQDLDDEQLEAFKRNPWMAPWHVASDGVGQAIDQAQRVIDPKDPADLNDPESLEALNAMFGPRINRGHGTNKRIRAAVPGRKPGTLAFDLDVEGEDGSRYTAPMTRNRGKAGDDDEVMQTDVGDIVNQVAGYKALRQVLSSPEAREKALAYGRQLGFVPQAADTWETVQGPGGSLLQRNTRTGEMKSIVGREPRSGGGYGYAPTSSMKEAQWLVANGIAPNISEAYKMARARAGLDGGQQLELKQLDYLGDQISDIDSQVKAYQDNYQEPPQDLLAQRQRLMQQREAIAGRIWGGEATPTGRHVEQPQAQSPQRQQTGDDFDPDAFLNDLGI